MKKIACLVLALVCLFSVALADTPSKTIDGLVIIKTNLDSNVRGKVSVDPSIVASANSVIKQLSKADKLSDVIQATDVNGNVIDLEKARVYELLPVDFTTDGNVAKDVIVNITCACVFAKNEAVNALMGVFENESLTWYGFEGLGQADGSVSFTLPQAFAAQYCNEGVLIALASK